MTTNEPYESAMDERLEKVQSLSDLELALLLCLITEQHCIVESDSEYLDELGEELELAVENVFGLRYSRITCTKSTTIDDFTNGLLVGEEKDSYFASVRSTPKDEPSSLFFSGSAWSSRKPFRTPPTLSSPEARHIANVVIVRNLEQAHHHVQTQALELIRSHRIFTRTSVQVPPKPFLFLALSAVDKDVGLTKHLNDQMFISHRHDGGDEMPNLTERSDRLMKDENSPYNEKERSRTKALTTKPKPRAALITKEDIMFLAAKVSSVRTSPEIRGYIHNVVVFARMHRAVASGVTATATRHFNLLARAIALLHGISYITPSIVALAARKIYRHRVQLTSPEKERSMQWGSSLEAICELLDGVTADDVIDEVLDAVETPL